MADPGDEELMQRYRDGEAGAFDLLYARHKGGVYRYLLRQCGKAEVAEELFQDVWMNLIRGRSTYTVQARFATWLYTLAHHRLIDHYRSQPKGTPVSFSDDPECLEIIPGARGDEPHVQAELKQDAQRVLACIAALPEAQREAFLMQQESGMSIEEIAQATGVPRETAKTRLRYAYARLRAALREAPA